MGSAGSGPATQTSDVVPLPTFKTKVFTNDYALHEKLGQGGFAVVYAASDTHGDNKLALKITDIRERCRQKSAMNEAAILSVVGGHENVCRLSESFVHGGLAFIVLELCDRTMPEALEATETLNEQTLRPFLRGMLRGIAAIHERRIVHRDVKIDNFMCCGPDNTVKLCDFGVSFALAPPGAVEDIECTGIAGTLPYMAPEMLQNREYGAKADVWSFGVIVHILLCGSFPYAPLRMTASSMKAAIFNGRPTPKTPRTSGGMSQPARVFVNCMLSKTASKRPTSEEALQDEFFFSGSLSQMCLRRQFEAAKHAGIFEDMGGRKANVGDVDVKLRQLQDSRGQPAEEEMGSLASEASTDLGSSLGGSELPKDDDSVRSSGVPWPWQSESALWFNTASECFTRR